MQILSYQNRLHSLQKYISVHEIKHEVTKVVTLFKNGGKFTKVYQSNTSIYPKILSIFIWLNADVLKLLAEWLTVHYENKPIQIYWKFYRQKMKKKKIRWKCLYFSYFCSKRSVGTR